MPFATVVHSTPGTIEKGSSLVRSVISTGENKFGPMSDDLALRYMVHRPMYASVILFDREDFGDKGEWPDSRDHMLNVPVYLAKPGDEVHVESAAKIGDGEYYEWADDFTKGDILGSIPEGTWTAGYNLFDVDGTAAAPTMTKSYITDGYGHFNVDNTLPKITVKSVSTEAGLIVSGTVTDSGAALEEGDKTLDPALIGANALFALPEGGAEGAKAVKVLLADDGSFTYTTDQDITKVTFYAVDAYSPVPKSLVSNPAELVDPKYPIAPEESGDSYMVGGNVLVYEFDSENVVEILSVNELEDVKDVANGLTLEEIALLLPENVCLVTSDERSVSAKITWDLEAVTGYDPADKEAQDFEVTGTWEVPEGLVTSKDFLLEVKVHVYVNASLLKF
jgi:hypothetical protein